MPLHLYMYNVALFVLCHDDDDDNDYDYDYYYCYNYNVFVCFDCCDGSDPRQVTDRSSSSQSVVEGATDATNQLSLQTVSVDDAELENLLCEAVANGNWRFVCELLLLQFSSERFLFSCFLCLIIFHWFVCLCSSGDNSGCDVGIQGRCWIDDDGDGDDRHDNDGIIILCSAAIFCLLCSCRSSPGSMSYSCWSPD